MLQLQILAKNPEFTLSALAPQIAHGLNRAIELIMQDIQQNVPVRTGALRRSYQTQPADAYDLTASVGSDLAYAPQHYPNLKQSSRPKLFSAKPSLFSGGPSQVEGLVEREIESALSRVTALMRY